MTNSNEVTGLPTLAQLTSEETAAKIENAMGRIARQNAWTPASGQGTAADQGSGQADNDPPQADAVYNEFINKYEVYRDLDDTAQIRLPETQRVIAIKSDQGQAWLNRFARKVLGRVVQPGVTAALRDALVADAYAKERTPSFLRVAKCESDLWVDLADEADKAVRVTKDDWSIQPNPPVNFRYGDVIRPLPVPEAPGDLNALRPFLNAPDDAQWVLLVGWLLKAFWPEGGCPVLVIHGPQGSGKSTTARVLKLLADPATVEAGTKLEGETYQFFIRAIHEWVLQFDNVSRLSPEISDDLCRIATGSALTKRTLYSNRGIESFEAKRPVILNGIESVITESDLADRAVVVELESIYGQPRRDEKAFWREFYAARPKILAGIFDALVCGLRGLDNVGKIDRTHRMVDFVRWVTACEPALGWTQGTFDRTYAKARQEAVEDLIDDSPVALHICRVLSERLSEKDAWEVRASDFYDIIKERANDTLLKHSDWPKDYAALGRKMARYTPNIEWSGFRYDRSRARGGRRSVIYRFWKA